MRNSSDLIIKRIAFRDVDSERSLQFLGRISDQSVQRERRDGKGQLRWLG